MTDKDDVAREGFKMLPAFTQELDVLWPDRQLGDDRYVIGYVSLDGRTITDWHGERILGRVVTATAVPLHRWSYVHGSKITAYRVRLADGRTAYGRSSEGIAIRLKLAKEHNDGTDAS